MDGLEHLHRHSNGLDLNCVIVAHPIIAVLRSRGRIT